jgi:hypothetical protein
VDGSTRLVGGSAVRVGDLVLARVTGTEGVDLVATVADLALPEPALARAAPLARDE